MDYEIIDKVATTVLKAGNQPTDGYRIWYRIPRTGTQDYIDIEKAKYSPSAAHALILPRVNDDLELFGFEPEQTA